MTTIAYRNGVLAADSGIIIGETAKLVGVQKIVTMKDGRLAGAVGSGGFCGDFLAWAQSGFSAGPIRAPRGSESDAGIVVRLDGTILLCEYKGTLAITVDYFAIGSGADFAYGAMCVGASAEVAVEAAIKHDPLSAGPVTSLSLPEEAKRRGR